MRKMYWLAMIFIIVSLVTWITLAFNNHIDQIGPRKLGSYLSLAIGLIVTLATWFAMYAYDSRREIWKLQNVVDFYKRRVPKERFQEMLNHELTEQAIEASNSAQALITLHTEGLQAAGYPVRPEHVLSDAVMARAALEHNFDTAYKAFYATYEQLEEVILVCRRGKLEDRARGWKAYLPKELAKTEPAATETV